MQIYHEVSEVLHASPTVIKRAFKNVYGESVGEYRKSIRLQEAQRLIQETDRPITEIAGMVGYSNPGHFAVAFRGKYAMTPSEYKRLVRSEGNSLL
ncbi:MAG: helix-turn-helix transcriptional regulator [Clostridiales bacterium]|nr:helix-turn-helix transcriptional regulator [Clostridiales bacterium]